MMVVMSLNTINQPTNQPANQNAYPHLNIFIFIFAICNFLIAICPIDPEESQLFPDYGYVFVCTNRKILPKTEMVVACNSILSFLQSRQSKMYIATSNMSSRQHLPIALFRGTH